MINKVFIELYVENIPQNIDFFCSVLNFIVVRNEGDFAELRHGDSIFLLNASASDVPGHFFHKKIDSSNNGIGVEIGIAVENISSVYERALNYSPKKEISKLVHQDWGMTDFRIVISDNYYLRVTSAKLE
jgi:catechol 2,3-dioxygenase-like lactoylglutathione lyase family enzyme